jgi:hypothetical protein
MDAASEQNSKVVLRCLFVGAMVGLFGGTLSKVEPVVVVPVTRVLDIDGTPYELGYDFTAKMSESAQWSEPRARFEGQPQIKVFGYQVQGPKVDLNLPERLKR